MASLQAAGRVGPVHGARPAPFPAGPARARLGLPLKGRALPEPPRPVQGQPGLGTLAALRIPAFGAQNPATRGASARRARTTHHRVESFACQTSRLLSVVSGGGQRRARKACRSGGELPVPAAGFRSGWELAGLGRGGGMSQERAAPASAVSLGEVRSWPEALCRRELPSVLPQLLISFSGLRGRVRARPRRAGPGLGGARRGLPGGGRLPALARPSGEPGRAPRTEGQRKAAVPRSRGCRGARKGTCPRPSAFLRSCGLEGAAAQPAFAPWVAVT